MSWNNCQFPKCESWAARPDGDYCETHRRQQSKDIEEIKKADDKRKRLLSKSNPTQKRISKNPKDWSNTFLCSDGSKVTQSEINEMMLPYRTMRGQPCEGCGNQIAVCKAHIIPRARCKVIGKTELIWEKNNIFDSCFACNSAIENPKGEAWKKLKNINYCLAFIEKHDRELFAKFESRLATQKPMI